MQVWERPFATEKPRDARLFLVLLRVLMGFAWPDVGTIAARFTRTFEPSSRPGPRWGPRRIEGSRHGDSVDGLGRRSPSVQLVELGTQRRADRLHCETSGRQTKRRVVGVDGGDDGQRHAVGVVECLGRQLCGCLLYDTP